VSKDGKITYFKIRFEEKNGNKEFDLYPNLIRNSKGQEGFSNNPDAKHYWFKDIFTYISYANELDRDKDTSQFHSHPVAIGDTIFYSAGYIILDSIVGNPHNDKYHFNAHDTAVMASLTVVSKDSMRYKSRPLYFLKNNQPDIVLDTVIAQNLVLGFTKFLENHKVEISVRESPNMASFVALKVYQFPFIRLVWFGTFVMMVGFIMSIVKRINANRRKAETENSLLNS
jgi:cytochrome c-type biogenesis protein CcmF